MNTNRRDFLALAAGGLALAGQPARLAAAATKPDLQLGFSLYGMKTLPLDRALAECKRIGYRTVELALIAGFPTEPGKLLPAARAAMCAQIKSAGLPVVSLLVNLGLTGDAKAHAAHLETLDLAGRFAKEIDPARPPIIQTIMGGKPGEWEANKATMAARLKDWNTAARRLGIKIAIKAHALQAVDTPEKLLWIFREAAGSNLSLGYDHSHYVLAGLSIEASFRPLAPHVTFVHVKDSRRENGEVRFLLPGEAATDYAAYFRLLRRHGYGGPLIVEVSSQIFNRPGYDPIATAEKCYAALAPALRA